MQLKIAVVLSISAALLHFSLLFLKESLSKLSKQQKLLLAQIAREHKMIVLALFSSPVTKKAKQAVWEKIRTQSNGVSASFTKIC